MGTSNPSRPATGAPVADTLAAGLAAAGLDWIVPAWPAPPDVGALATTRAGGIGAGPAATLDLGVAALATGGTSAATVQNRRRLTAFLPSPPVWLDQVHGTAVAVLDAATVAAARAAPPVADAAVTSERGIVCAVRTADCLPVLFANRRGGAVGVAHGGWRGLAGGVLEATVSALATLGARPGDLVAWFGPAIGPNAFEVGSDVRDAFSARDPGATQCFAPLREGKWHADLYRLARRRLAAAGVHDVHGGDFCTFSDATRFHSYRRERAAGRMATLVWLAPNGGGRKL
jgi:hypothetical protein